MIKIIQLEPKKSETPSSDRKNDRSKISNIIQFPNSQPKQTPEETLRKIIGLGDNPPETRKWFDLLELDGDVLYYLNEEAWTCTESEAIKAKVFSDSSEYKSVKKILGKLNAQEFLTQLKQIEQKDKFTKCSPAQIQAIQDEIEERRV
jgi:hypothetical protein